MANLFQPAEKHKSKLRLGLIGPSGSGKTLSALKIGRALVGEKGRIAMLDTEHGSASKYADKYRFDVFEPQSFSPEVFTAALNDAENNGYDLCILDSLTHAWAGKDGALELVDAATMRSKSGNRWASWREVTPLHNRLIDAMLGAKMHVIATMRSKTEWLITKDDSGKSIIQKVGLQPIQRDGMEYEFDVVGDIDHGHIFAVSKTRCEALDGKMFSKPGEDVARILLDWLEGTPSVAPAEEKPLDSYKKEVSNVCEELNISKAEANAFLSAHFGKPTKQLTLTEWEAAPHALRGK